MVDTNAPVQIVITEEDARGAEGSDKVSPGATLVPMLIALIVLTVLGVGAVALFVGRG